jgi:hypothetical protein
MTDISIDGGDTDEENIPLSHLVASKAFSQKGTGTIKAHNRLARCQPVQEAIARIQPCRDREITAINHEDARRTSSADAMADTDDFFIVPDGDANLTPADCRDLTVSVRYEDLPKYADDLLDHLEVVLIPKYHAEIKQIEKQYRGSRPAADGPARLALKASSLFSHWYGLSGTTLFPFGLP